MFGFATIVSSALVLLLASSVTASPRPISQNARSLNLRLPLSIRSTTDGDPDVVPQCEKQCDQLNDAFDNSNTTIDLCNSQTMALFTSCFDCEVGAGAATAASLQPTINEFVSTCADLDHPVSNFTVSAAKTGGSRSERVALAGAGTFVSVVAGLVTLSLAVL